MRQLWDLLDARSRWRSLILAVLTSVAGFVEILSVGLVIPFIAVASSSHPFGVASALTTSFVRLLERVHIPYTTAGLGGIFFLGVYFTFCFVCINCSVYVIH